MKNLKHTILLQTIIEKIQFIAGTVLLLFFGLCTVLALTDEIVASMRYLPLFIICDVLSLSLIFLSRKRRNLVIAFKKYTAFLSNDPTGSISNLANVVGSSEDIVLKNLNSMIEKR